MWKQKQFIMTIEEVKQHIYEHISRENEMGLPPHESWEGISEGEDWVDICVENGYSVEQMKTEIFDEVYEEWSEDNL